MKQRTKGFLSPENIDHDSEIFDYIKELHDYLWAFVLASNPSAMGRLEHYVDNELDRQQKVNNAVRVLTFK
jgi:hypothetical protein